MGHGLSRVLSLIHPRTCHQALLDRVTACVSHTENTTKFCGYGKSRVHYLGQCCQTTILHCTACCAVLCKLKLSLRCVLSGCTVTSRPPCRYAIGCCLETVQRSVISECLLIDGICNDSIKCLDYIALNHGLNGWKVCCHS